MDLADNLIVLEYSQKLGLILLVTPTSRIQAF